MNTDALTSGSTVKNQISLKTGIRIQCNTENFVPVVVPGLSASSSSNFLSSQEIDHPTSSLSSSTSPTTTVSSDSETRAREDLSGIDSYPESVLSEHVERKEQGDPLCSDIQNGCTNSEKISWMMEILKCRDSHASSSHEPSLEPAHEKCGFG